MEGSGDGIIGRVLDLYATGRGPGMEKDRLDVAHD